MLLRNEHRLRSAILEHTYRIDFTNRLRSTQHDKSFHSMILLDRSTRPDSHTTSQEKKDRNRMERECRIMRRPDNRSSCIALDWPTAICPQLKPDRLREHSARRFAWWDEKVALELFATPIQSRIVPSLIQAWARAACASHLDPDEASSTDHLSTTLQSTLEGMCIGGSFLGPTDFRYTARNHNANGLDSYIK